MYLLLIPILFTQYIGLIIPFSLPCFSAIYLFNYIICIRVTITTTTTSPKIVTID